jgi:hypothetical protein
VSRRRRGYGLPPMWRVGFLFTVALVVPVVVMMRAGTAAGLLSGLALVALFVVCDVLAAFRRRRYRRSRTPLVSFPPPLQPVAQLAVDENAYLSRLSATRRVDSGFIPDPWSWDPRRRA